MIQIRMAGCSHTGARRYNEDAVHWGQGRFGHIAVLADGAGGHSRGAEAAQHTVACVQRAVQDEALAFSSANLTQLVQRAHAELLHKQTSSQLDERMHCTVVLLWIDPSHEHVLWTHVGDSRLYRLRHGQVDMITADDSVVQRMVQAGLIRPEQVREHPQKNQLLAALGMDGEIEPHTVVRPVQLCEGDAFLLCSDGWWEGFEAADLVKTLTQSLDPEQWLDQMRKIIEMRARPRQDNFSAIAVWVGDPGEVTHPGEEDTRPRL
jgi:PPM family protein phosphatase